MIDAYPAIGAFGFLCAGVGLAAWVPMVDSSVSLTMVTACFAGLLAALHGLAGRLLVPFVALSFVALGFHFGMEATRDGSDFEPSAEICAVHATVVETISSSGSGVRVLLMERGYNETERRELPGFGRVSIRYQLDRLTAGDRIAFRARVQKPENRGNPGEYDWVIHCKQERILWLAYTESRTGATLIRRGNPAAPAAILFSAREAISRFIDDCSGAYLKGILSQDTIAEVRAIHKGLILGDRGEISKRLQQSFVDSGLAHMLAASGLNVAMAAILATILCRAVCRSWPELLLWIPRGKVSVILAVPVVLVYCGLVGAKVPMVRATIMGLVVAGAVLGDRRWDSLNSLAVAGLLIVCQNPLSLFTASFQLSFAAVCGIYLVFTPLMSRFFPTSHVPQKGVATSPEPSWTKRMLRDALRNLVASAVMSVASTVAVTPFLIAHFRALPVNAMAANIAATFPLTGGFILGLAGCVVGLCSAPLGALILVPADICVLLVIRSAQTFGDLSWATVKVGHLASWQWPFVLALVCSLAWLLRTLASRSLVAVAASSVALVAAIHLPSTFGSRSEDLTVVFLNVGRADAIYVGPPGRRGLFVDGGYMRDSYDAGQSVLLPFLRWNGSHALDGIIMTHPEMDHIGGFLSVVRSVPLARVWWNPLDRGSAHLRDILDQATDRGAVIVAADRTVDPIHLGPVDMRFLNPPAKTGLGTKRPIRANDASVVTRIEYRDISFLLTGDLEQYGEEELLASGIPLSATVLKVGHHGSCTSTSQRFLDAVRPRIAVISCGYRMARGGPCQEVLARLAAAGTTVFWTGRDGAITIATDGKDLKVSTGKR